MIEDIQEVIMPCSKQHKQLTMWSMALGGVNTKVELQVWNMEIEAL
jgi:hypothetical protein